MTQEEFDVKVQHTGKVAAEWVLEFKATLERLGVEDTQLAKKLALKFLEARFNNAANEIEREYWRYVSDSIVFYREAETPKTNTVGEWKPIEEK